MNVVLFVFLLLAVGFAVTAVSGAPWVPVRAFDVEELLDDGGVAKGTSYLELGCGDGRLVKAAAKRGAIAVGYELNPVLFVIAWLRCWGQPNATVRLGNFWRVNLANWDTVMAFLVPRTMPRLGHKATEQMSTGSLLISYIFEIPGQKPLRTNKSWLVYGFGAPKKSSPKKPR